jgi:hypothetical protein
LRTTWGIACFGPAGHRVLPVRSTLGMLSTASAPCARQCLQRARACMSCRSAPCKVCSNARAGLGAAGPCCPQVEARAEEYHETLALLRMLNAILAALVPPPADGGSSTAQFTAFAVDQVRQSAATGSISLTVCCAASLCKEPCSSCSLLHPTVLFEAS